MLFSAARWRLTIIFTVVLAVILAASGIVVYLTTRSVLFDRVDNDLADRARQDISMLTQEPRGPGGPGGGGGDHDFIPSQLTTGGYFFAEVDSGNNLVGYSSNVDTTALAPAGTLGDALQDGSAYASTTSSQGDPLRVSTRALDGTPSRSMSKRMVVLLSIEAAGSASALYQFCETLLLTIFT